MSLGDKLEEHDAVEKTQSVGETKLSQANRWNRKINGYEVGKSEKKTKERKQETQEIVIRQNKQEKTAQKNQKTEMKDEVERALSESRKAENEAKAKCEKRTRKQHQGQKVRWSMRKQMSGEMKEQLVWSHRAVRVNWTWIRVPDHNRWSQSWKLDSLENDSITTHVIKKNLSLFQRTHDCLGLGQCCSALPVVMSKHGAVTVAEIQTPDLHISVSGARRDKCVILVNRNTRSESGREDCGSRRPWLEYKQIP